MSISLKLPPNTRFGYVVILLESLEANKETLQETMLKKDLNIDKKN